MTLEGALECAEGMRRGGWLPHEEVHDWDTTELADAAGRPLAEISRVVAARVRGLADRAAAAQTRPMARVPDCGVRIGCDAVGPQPQPAPQTVTTPRDRSDLWSAVVADVATGALERGEALVYGRLFMGPKGRPIYDAAWTNDHVRPEAKTVAYGSIRDLLAAGGWATKLDLKAAFRSVAVHPDDRPLLGVMVDGVSLRYARLPFGLASSPQLFCGMLRRTLATVQVPRGCAVVDYVDDIAVAAPTAAACAALTADVIERLLDDGWRVACAKTFARPTPTLLFLGFEVDVADKTVALRGAKVAKVKAWLADAMAGGPGWRDALTKALGMAAWAAPALRGAGFVAPELYRALTTGHVGDEAREAAGMLADMFDHAATPTRLDPPDAAIAVVTDAGDTAWCAALYEDGAITACHRGPLPHGTDGWSSTAREALAVVEAVRAFGGGLDVGRVGVQVHTDSQALTHIMTRGRTRSPEVAKALSGLMDLIRQGLRITASWCRRSEGHQPLVDAGTARALRWHPSRGMLCWLAARWPADIHVGAGSRDVAMAPRYTADIDDETRSEVIRQAAGGWSGWVGTDGAVCVTGLRVLCHPRWGGERAVVRQWRDAAEIVVVTRRTAHVDSMFTGWPGHVEVHVPPPRLCWWVAEDGESVRTIRVPDLVVVRWSARSASQVKAEEEVRLKLMSLLNPGPMPVVAPGRPSGKRPRLDQARRGVPSDGLAREAIRRSWEKDAAVGAGGGAPAAMASTLAGPRQDAWWPGRGERQRQWVDAHAVIRGAWGEPPLAEQPRVPEPSPSTRVGVAAPQAGAGGHGADAWQRAPLLVDVIRSVARSAPMMDSSVGETIMAKVDKASDRVTTARRRARSASTRSELAARSMLAYLEANGASGAAATPDALDLVAMAYADDRLEGVVGARKVAVDTVAGEASSLAAGLRAVGFSVGPYLGIRTASYLVARGAAQRRSSSNALPLLLRWLLTVEPPSGSRDHAIWASRVTQSGFMLRPGVAGALRRGHMTPWGWGYVLSWPSRHKSSRADVCQRAGTPQAVWMVTACGHPAVKAVLDVYISRAESDGCLLWPEATPRATLEWLRRVRPVSPEEVPRLTAHGFRLGTDLELDELKAPKDEVNVLGWWARENVAGRSTQAYYSSVHLGRLLMITSRLGGSVTHHPSPGVHTGTPAATVDWEKEWEAVSRRLPAEPPNIRQAALTAAAAAGAKAGDEDGVSE